VPLQLANATDSQLPARFLWLGDAVLIACAFGLSHLLLPALQALVMPTGILGPVLAAMGVPPSQGVLEATPRFTETLGIGAVTLLCTLLSLDLLGGYRPLMKQSRTRVLLASVVGPLGGLAATTVVLFGLRIHDFSRLFLFSFVGLEAVCVAWWRMGLRSYKVRRFAAGAYVRDVLLVGAEHDLRRLIEHFRRHVAPYAYRVSGVLSVGPDQFENNRKSPSPVQVPRLGAVDRLGDILIHRPIADVIVALPSSTESRWLSQVIDDCDYFRTTLRIVPEAVLSADLRDLRPDHLYDAIGLPALVLSPTRSTGHPLFLKRVFDMVISATLLLLLAPIFAAIALAIKLTTPQLPVFYPWRVVGYRGRVFVGYKFTTMQADADSQKSALAHLNEMTGPVFKIKEDPRVTRLGRFLRKYSLNELPQLWSVLKGDMSLVGPRPAGPHELERYEFWHKRKLSIMPGITCLWQVRGRNKISNFDDWVRMDLEYIDNWSLWLDFKILVWTALAVVRGTGS
jgi:exopolysaccharide biosynthesis polyprenyl glycosylphosphotransferase